MSTTYSASELFIDKQVIKIFILPIPKSGREKKIYFILSSRKLLAKLITLSAHSKGWGKWFLIKHTLHFMGCTEKLSGLVTPANVTQRESSEHRASGASPPEPHILPRAVQWWRERRFLPRTGSEHCGAPQSDQLNTQKLFCSRLSQVLFNLPVHFH